MSELNTSKETAIAAMKMLPIDELYSYAYYMAEAHSGALENIDKWAEEWKKEKSKSESLRQQITELQKKCRAADEVIDFYASNNWNSAKYKDGPVFFAEERGGAAARQFQKDYPKTEITQEEA